MLRIERDIKSGEMKIPVVLYKLLHKEFVFLKEKNTGELYFTDLRDISDDLSSRDVYNENAFHLFLDVDLKLIARRVLYDGELNYLKLLIESDMVSMPVNKNAMPHSWEVMSFVYELGVKYQELE